MNSFRFAALGGLASLATVVGLSLVGGSAADAPSSRQVVHSDPARPLAPQAHRICAADAAGMRMETRPDPGLTDVKEVPVIPTFRSYMPAKVQALVCPITQDACALPETVASSLWVATDYRTYRRADVQAEVISRGHCVELRWIEKAEVLWPDAEPGVVQWAVVVGSAPEALDPEAWRRGGGLMWRGDVVYAGQSGAPEVY